MKGFILKNKMKGIFVPITYNRWPLVLHGLLRHSPLLPDKDQTKTIIKLLGNQLYIEINFLLFAVI
jgi:hypothetical protein